MISLFFVRKSIIDDLNVSGDIKYLKTTIQGLSGYNPHYSCLYVIFRFKFCKGSTRSPLDLIGSRTVGILYNFRLISAETGPTAATREHLGLARALSIPVFVIITKRDMVEKPQLDRYHFNSFGICSRDLRV